MSARSLNKVTLIGNLTRDPELRYTPQGTAVCTFGLATNRSWQPSDGSERQEETEWHKIVAWSKLAEICSQILTKGRKAYVEGRIQNRKWQTQEGQDRETTEIVIDNMIALGAPKNSSGGYAPQDGYNNSFQNSPAPVAADPVDDVPENVVDDAVLEAEDAAEDTSTSSAQENPAKVKKEKKVAEEVSVDDIPF